MRRLLATVLVVAGLLAPVAAAPTPIKATVTPTVGFSPLKVRITLLLGIEVIEQFVCFVIEDVDSTCVQHDSSWLGSQRTIEIKNVPAGEWRVFGEIRTLRGELLHRSAPATLIVRANAGEDD